MSHMHIPDGVLPIWIVLIGWVATALILSFCIRRVSRIDIRRKVPLIGIVSALMIVGMTLEIVPIAYHINLGVVAGIILGPALAFISVFIVDLIIAMFGHGGITVVGLNTIVTGAEAVFGYYLFQLFLALLGKQSPGWASSLAVIVGLFLSTNVMLGIVYASHIDPVKTFEAEHDIKDADHEDGVNRITNKGINFVRFAKTVFILAPLGWLLEAVITGLVIKYISRVRPDLIAVERT
ncbi:MAG: energy-coupling factor ABC transporter permease [Deltaproteobacteria bacterium]